MSATLTWLTNIVRHRPTRAGSTVAGVAVAVALLATLMGFFASTESSMTKQAVADVAVDWQIQLNNETSPDAAIAELQRAPGATKVAPVGYADVNGFESVTGTSTQTTGAGKVVGIPADYRTLFPAQIRDLIGQGQVLLAQQTAANLHAAPGSTITILRPGLPAAEVTVDAIVDLPLADPFFQTVGAPAGAAPIAPPDNVLLLPLDQWHALFDPVAAVAPTAVHLQIHASIPHNLPAAPTSAYTQVTGLARNYETRMAGAGVVGDNLAARLDVARSDALYARVLFLFLGLPGAALAGILTAVIVGATAGQRRRDASLLRLRGASAKMVLRMAAVEAVAVGIAGAILGVLIAGIAVRISFGRWTFGNGLAASLQWAGIAAAAGVILAVGVAAVPTWRSARGEGIAQARRAVRRDTAPWWERIGVDVILLAIAGVVYWQAARGGYQVVLAPEGVPRVSVSYTSLFAPLLLWAGVALLAARLVRLVLAHNGRHAVALVQPVGGRLSPLVSGAMSRQRGRVATGVVVVTLAVAFALSTSIFNATYEAQSLVDAELTNGADVTVSGGQSADLAPFIPAITAVNGVQAVEPMQHRFAYVGTDLQDLYGIDPVTLTHAARLSDAYFVGARAKAVMDLLAATSDGVLVSPETVLDFQLQPGDSIRIRLQSATDGSYQAVPFHYVGIAREFPTAPSDSFLVANASYVAQQTGSAAVETVLIKTNASPAKVADETRAALGGLAGATVRDIEAQRQVTRSSLTAVSLRGLTRIELGFALALAAAGAGLVLVLGLEERRRTLAIASALGAKPRQLGAFVWSEAGFMIVGGLAAGGLLGWGIAHMLVKLLTHVFDPPPQSVSIPWLYITLVGAVTVAAIVAAAQATIRNSQRDVLQAIRRL